MIRTLRSTLLAAVAFSFLSPLCPASAEEKSIGRREEVRKEHAREDEPRPDERMTAWVGKTKLIFGGSLEFETKYEYDLDLDPHVNEDVGLLRLQGDIEVELEFRPRLEAFLELKYSGETDLKDDANEETTHTQMKLGEAWFHARDIRGTGVGFKIGRQEFDDAREWLYDRDLDALRIFWDLDRFGLEFAVGERFSNASARFEDITHYILYASFEPKRRVFFDGYLIFSKDHSSLEQRSDREDSDPLWIGARAYGRVFDKRLRYWADLAYLTGKSVDIERTNGDYTAINRQYDAYALDIGATWIFRKKNWEPNFTLGYAIASGDSGSRDGRNREYRQTGLQDNSGKFYGQKSFRYYGEVLDPELSNMRILTAGIGIRPPRKTSLDLVFHHYRQAQPAPSLRFSDLDARPLGRAKQLGTALDLVFGWKYQKRYEIKANAGIFRPGGAFAPEERETASLFKFEFRINY